MHKSWQRKTSGSQNQWLKFILDSVNLMWWIYEQQSVCCWRQDTYSGGRSEVFTRCSVFHQLFFHSWNENFTIAVPISFLLASSLLQPLLSPLATRISQNLSLWWTQMFFYSTLLSSLLLWWPSSLLLAPPLFYCAFPKLQGWVGNHPAAW